jgi:hypothetical protein
MANALYTKGKEKMLSAAINYPSDTIKAALVNSSYTPNLATDEFLTTVSTYVLNTSQTLASKAVTGGAFDAADVTWTAVTAGATAKFVVLYKDTGSAATSPLLALIDTITGFPLATNGADITVQWDNGTYKIFSL